VLTLAIALALTQTSQHALFKQPNLPASTPAFFEAFNGAGTLGPCSTTPPTGAKGEAMTTIRASGITCTKTAAGGLATTGIADGDLVMLGNNVPAIEYDRGILGPLSERASTNGLIKSRLPCNAAWGDVGTPNCTANVATGPWGGTTMASITDDAAGAFEGRSQVIATTSATVHSVSCYVKWSSGTPASASLVLAGTGSATGDCTGTMTGLSATSSARISCSSSAAYGGALTAVTVTIRVGTVVGDQGTLLVEGCQWEPAAGYPTSFIETDAAAATRAAPTMYFNTPLPPSDTGSMAATLTAEWVGPSANSSPLLVATSVAASPGNDLIFLNSPSSSAVSWRCVSANNGAGVFNTGAAAVGTGPWRSYCAMTPGGTVTGSWGGNAMTASAAQSGTFTAAAYLHVGQVGGSNHVDGIVTQICRDPDSTRCR